MKPKQKTRKDLERKIMELEAQLASTYHFANQTIHKASTDHFTTMNIRKRCIAIMNQACYDLCGLSMSDLPDLPCVMYALDEMEEYIEEEGDTALVSELYSIAQEAVAELLEEEGFDFVTS